MPDWNEFAVELLYFSHGYTSQARLHRHPYCQIEYCISGELIASGNGREFHLRGGEFWLIPAGMPHQFHQKSVNCGVNFISIKFRAVHVPESQVSCDPVGVFYLEEIRKLIDGESAFEPHSRECAAIMENALSGLLRRMKNIPAEAGISEFEQKLHTAIRRFGAAGNVDVLADFFALTRAQFKYRFLHEIGHGNIKHYIDEMLLRMIERQLCYSDLPLNRISTELNFPSLYAFSRYFRNHRGESPSEYRKKHPLPE